ncbi:hypothetical protein F4776DRAFT_669946 [Hypoxylon sp. NC0597]|nr:hypothetical protein F4776DRAFT_669946 [Hypoxylon sp. NC0597]
MPRPPVSANGIVDEAFLNHPLREHVISSMLRLSVPTRTSVPSPPVGSWDFIEHPVKAIILKVMFDDLKSFNMACAKLRLRQKEVREFLHTNNNQPRRPSYTIDRAAVAYGCEFLNLQGLGKYAKQVYDLSRQVDAKSLLNIDYSDLKVLDHVESMSSPIRFGFPTRERTRDSTTRGILPPGTDFVAIAFKLAKPASINGLNTPIFRVDRLRLPAGATVVGPEGRKTLREGGVYTVVYPAGYPKLPDAYEMFFCENSQTHRLPAEPKDARGEDASQESTQESAQESTEPSTTQANTPAAPQANLGSRFPPLNPRNQYSGTHFFDDAFFNLDPSAEAERAIADNLVPQRLLDQHSGLTPLAESSQSQDQLITDLLDGSQFLLDAVNDHGVVPLTTNTPLSLAGGATNSPTAHFTPIGSDLEPAVPETSSPGTQLSLKPQENPIGLIPGTRSRKIEDLVSKGYRALIQLRLPKGYFIISPLGNKTNLDPLHGMIEDGESPPGHGGEYTIIPPGHDVNPHVYRCLPLANPDLMRMAFEEPMAVFRDGLMFPRLLGKGLHLFSLRDRELRICCKEGFYDLTKPLADPETPTVLSQSTESNVHEDPIDTIQVSRSAVKTAPKKARKKAAAKPKNRKGASRRSTRNKEEFDTEVNDHEDDGGDSGVQHDDENYIEGSSSQMPKKSKRNLKRKLDSITEDTTPQKERPTKVQATGSSFSADVVAQGEKSSQKQAQHQSQILRINVLKNAAALAENARKKSASSSVQAQAESQVQAQEQPKANTPIESTPELQTRTSPRLQALSQSQQFPQPQEHSPAKQIRFVLVNQKPLEPASSSDQPEVAQSLKLTTEDTSPKNSQGQSQDQDQSQERTPQNSLKATSSTESPSQPSAGSGLGRRTRSAMAAELEAKSETQPKKPKIKLKTPAKAQPKVTPRSEPQNLAKTRSQTQAQQRTTRSKKRYSM